MTKPDFEIRAARSAFVVFAVLIMIPLIISLAAAFKQPSMWKAVGICITSAIFVFIWLRSFRIQVSEREVKYSTLFGGTKVILTHQIAWAKIESNLHFHDHFWSTVTLTLGPKPTEKVKPIRINMKIFSRTGIRLLMDALEAEGIDTEQ